MRGESKSFDPAGRGASQYLVKKSAESSNYAIWRCFVAVVLSQGFRQADRAVETVQRPPGEMGSNVIGFLRRSETGNTREIPVRPYSKRESVFRMAAGPGVFWEVRGASGG
jgi:hypothetical protein